MDHTTLFLSKGYDHQGEDKFSLRLNTPDHITAVDPDAGYCITGCA